MTPRSPWRALPVVLAGAFIAVASFFLVSITLPDISRTLDAGPAALQMVVVAYNVTYAAFLVAGGRLGDRHGRRRLFVTGLAAFAVASLGCALAPDIATLIGARAVQGAAAGLLTPQVLGWISAAFDPDRRGRALGYYGATLGIGCVAGQLLGGTAVELDIANLGWRSVFWLFALLSAAVAVLAHRVVPENVGAAVPVDVRGGLGLAAVLTLALVPLGTGNVEGWPLWCWIGLGLTVPAALLLARGQRRSEAAGGSPLLPPSLLRLPALRRGLGMVAVFFVGTGAFLLAVPLSLEEGLHLSPLATGLTLVPYALAFLAVSLVLPRLSGRIARHPVPVGAAVLTVGLLGLVAQAATGYADLTPLELQPALIAAGAGQGLVMISVFGTVLSQVPARRAGLAGGLLTTTQQIGLGIGVAAIGGAFLSLADSAGWGPATVVALLATAVMTVATGLVSIRGDRRTVAESTMDTEPVVVAAEPS